MLKRLTHAEQRQALFRVKNGADATFDAAFDFIRGEPAPQRKPVQPPGRALNDMEVFNQQLARLVSAWNGASRPRRRESRFVVREAVMSTTRSTRRIASVPRDPEARRQMQEAVLDGAAMMSEGCRREDLEEAAREAWPELFGRAPTLH